MDEEVETEVATRTSNGPSSGPVFLRVPAQKLRDIATDWSYILLLMRLIFTLMPIRPAGPPTITGMLFAEVLGLALGAMGISRLLARRERSTRESIWSIIFCIGSAVTLAGVFKNLQQLGGTNQGLAVAVIFVAIVAAYVMLRRRPEQTR